MLIFKLKNYQEFNNIFGSRRTCGHLINTVLLNFWKYRYSIDRNGQASAIKSLDDLYSLVLDTLSNYKSNSSISENIALTTFSMGSKVYTWPCGKYSVIRNNEIDYEDYRKINVLGTKFGKNLSIKAGKFFKSIIEANHLRLGESAEIYCCEVFQRNWEAYVKEKISSLVLHVDKNFDKIYSISNCSDKFGSCMMDKNLWWMYKECIDCNAAYLTDSSGKIVARCILFNNVQFEDGETRRFAERQYGLSSFYKRVLINKLINENLIDCYKTIDSGARDCRNIVSIDGIKLVDTRCRIPISLKLDTETRKTPYMDTFKFFTNGYGYNYNSVPNIECVLENV